MLAQAGLIIDTSRGDYNSPPIISGGGDGGAQVYNGWSDGDQGSGSRSDGTCGSIDEVDYGGDGT